MNMNLYEIEAAIMECVDEETGEIIDIERLDNLMMARDTKIENIACWIKDLQSHSKRIKEEMDKFKSKKESVDNNISRLKTYLSGVLAGEKFKTAKCSIYYMSTESVDVSDISALPEWALRRIEPEANKDAIKKAIKSGESVDGASLIKNHSIVIK